mmetsp:Transcript_13577/g.42243  ORF Transcript_13577/g.42243 Transcript_13577/m.42243 type:complete len:542 (+) Transcript_13577:234-1859(+)
MRETRGHMGRCERRKRNEQVKPNDETMHRATRMLLDTARRGCERVAGATVGARLRRQKGALCCRACHCARGGPISGGSTGHWLPLTESRLNPMVLCTNLLSARAAISRCSASVLPSGTPSNWYSATAMAVVADANGPALLRGRADDRRRRAMSPSTLFEMEVEHVRRPSIPMRIDALRDRFRGDRPTGRAPGPPSCGTGAGLRPSDASHSSTRRSLTLLSSGAGSRSLACAHWRRVAALALRMMSESCGWQLSTISLSGDTAESSSSTPTGRTQAGASHVAVPLRSAGGVFWGDGTPRFLNASPARRNLDFAGGTLVPGAASTAARGNSNAELPVFGSLGMRRSQLRSRCTATDGSGGANGCRAPPASGGLLDRAAAAAAVPPRRDMATALAGSSSSSAHRRDDARPLVALAAAAVAAAAVVMFEPAAATVVVALPAAGAGRVAMASKRCMPERQPASTRLFTLRDDTSECVDPASGGSKSAGSAASTLMPASGFAVATTVFTLRRLSLRASPLRGFGRAAAQSGCTVAATLGVSSSAAAT